MSKERVVACRQVPRRGPEEFVLDGDPSQESRPEQQLQLQLFCLLLSIFVPRGSKL
jgi:hypothetical protein